jgi:AraC family transcriptional regulator
MNRQELGGLSCPTEGQVHQKIQRASDIQRRADKMLVSVRKIHSIKALCIEHNGPYLLIGQSFGKLISLLNEHGITPGTEIAFYYDDPNTTSSENLRAHAGVILKAEPEIPIPQTTIVTAGGALTAVYTYRGPYEGLPEAWNALYGRWLPGSGYVPAEAPGYEIYLNSCRDVSPEELLTEIHLPVVEQQRN